MAVVLAAPVLAAACDRSDLTLLGVSPVAGGTEVRVRLCIGAGITAATKGGDAATKSFGFIGLGGGSLVSFSPATVTGTGTGTIATGVDAGPGTFASLPATSRLIYQIPTSPTTTFACSTTTAACGALHTECNDFTLVFATPPHEIRAVGVEGGGNLVAGCFPNPDMAVYPSGLPCTMGSECSTGFCSDGICCTSDCGSSTTDCRVCAPACAPFLPCYMNIGSCVPEPTTHVCRAATSMCDATETCDGVLTTCPADAPAPNGTVCSDGLVCDGTDTCTSGICIGGSPVVCDDMNACTASYCAEPGGCRHTPIAGCCNVSSDCPSDGDACTTEVCSGLGGTCSSVRIAGCGDAGTDAAIVAVDAGNDAAVVAIDAGNDAAVAIDAGSDAAMLTPDVGIDAAAAAIDAGLDASGGADAALDVDAAGEDGGTALIDGAGLDASTPSDAAALPDASVDAARHDAAADGALAMDAVPSAETDAGGMPPPQTPSCGCRIARTGPSMAWAVSIVVAFWIRRRVRRRRHPR